MRSALLSDAAVASTGAALALEIGARPKKDNRPLAVFSKT
jgi:hypothetical protein